MKPSFGTKLASYFVDIVLEKSDSKFSGPLEVLYKKGRFALCTQNAVYSYDDLYYNFYESFSKLDLDVYNIKKVLVLGLGLGSIPLLLEKKFNKKYSYTLVEIDNKIINLAKKYTLSTVKSPTQIICADALEFVKETQESFDLVAVDIFIDDQIPSPFESIDFLNNVKKILNSNALLMYNRLSYNDVLKRKTEKFFDEKFKKVFQDSVYLTLSGNRMLLNKMILK